MSAAPVLLSCLRLFNRRHPTIVFETDGVVNPVSSLAIKEGVFRCAEFPRASGLLSPGKGVSENAFEEASCEEFPNISYIKAIGKYASQASHVLDRFAIMRQLSKAIDHIRAGKAGKVYQQSPGDFPRSDYVHRLS